MLPLLFESPGYMFGSWLMLPLLHCLLTVGCDGEL